MTQTISTITRSALPDLAKVAKGAEEAGAASAALTGIVGKLGGAAEVQFGSSAGVSGDLQSAFGHMVRTQDSLADVAPEAKLLADRISAQSLVLGNFAGMFDTTAGVHSLQELQDLKLAVPKTVTAARDQVTQATALLEAAAANDKLAMADRVEISSALMRMDDAGMSIDRVRDGAAGATSYSDSLNDAANGVLVGRRALRFAEGDAGAQTSEALIGSAFDLRSAAGSYALVERSPGLEAATTGVGTRAEKLTETSKLAGDAQTYLQGEHEALTAFAASPDPLAKATVNVTKG